MTQEILKAKVQRRRLERVWRRTRYRCDRSHYRAQCNLCNGIMEKAKANFYANIILENSEDPKKLWKFINNIFHRFPAPSLPENLSLKTICEKFSNFLLIKLLLFAQNFQAIMNSKTCIPRSIYFFNEYFGNRNRDKKIIMQSKSTSSHLDPFPTSLLEDCLDVLVETISSISNKSFQEGVFPDQCKKTSAEKNNSR